MDKRTTLFSRVVLLISLISLFSLQTFAQKQLGTKSVADYTSIAKITGNGTGKSLSFYNPATNANGTWFAGTFNGTLNSVSTQYYCIDLGNPLATNQDYWDEGSTSSQITYILNTYFPYASGPGQLNDLQKEAAAVQFAIWHFSDGAQISSITNDTDVKNRAGQIIADATSNHNNVQSATTLLIVPASGSFAVGINPTFKVYAFDINGAPVANVSIALTTNLGSLSTASVTTNANGESGLITLTHNAVGTATVKAQANVVIAQGTKYVHKISPNSKQKLVLATPATDKKEVTASFNWYTPNTCDLKGYVTYTQGGWGSPSNSGPGKIRDNNFSNVFPSGLVLGGNFKLTLTSASAVKNFLPQGGTAAAFTQNYNNVTNTSAGVLAGQLVALKLSVNYSAAGVLGSNTTPIGNLVIKSGPFVGYTVSQFLAFAEAAIGGGNLNGFTFSQINDAATALNENFDNGTVDKGYLDCNGNVKASIGDKVWEDTNSNGVQDSGEPVKANVTVQLYDCNDNLQGTTVTNSNGIYSFTNLVPGDYYVKFILPLGYTFTSLDLGGDDSKDSDANTSTGKTICTTLSGGENDLTWDAGLVPVPCQNKIGDFIWHDKDTDGIQDANEAGIANVAVELLNSANSIVATATTDANGKYEFSNVLNGTYKVKIAASNFTGNGVFAGSANEKWFITFKDKGSNNEKDSDGDLSTKTASVTVNCNDDITIDFGFFKSCVTLEKSGPATVNVGEKITYKFVVSNCGDVILGGGATVYDPMLRPTGDHMVKYFKLYPGEEGEVEVEYTTTPDNCGTLKNDAYVIGHPELNNYNFNGTTIRDDDSHTVIVNCTEKEADLEIIKTSSKTSVECGAPLTYTITVKNNGPDKSEGIKVSDLLPSGAIYVSNSASQGSYNNITGIWTVGDLNNGLTATLTINVTIDCGQINSGSFDLGIAKEYNLFVLEDITQPSADTEGKVAVGGNATFSNYSLGDKLPENSGDVLIVGKHLNFTSGHIYNGNVVYGQTTNLPIDAVTVDGTIETGTPIDFTAAKIELQSLSATLSNYAANGTTTMQWGGLTLTGNDPYLNVFAVNGSDLTSAHTVAITVPNGAVVLVNINGTSVSWTGGLTVTGTSITNVLYNFYEATSLTIQGIDVTGTVLAPYAHLNFPAGVINGQVICKSMEGAGQFNLDLFEGNIPFEKEITNVASLLEVITNDPNAVNNTSSVKVVASNIGEVNNGGAEGDGWQQVSGFGEGEIVYTMAYSGSSIYAGTWGGKIYSSTNGGTTWTRINSDMNVGFIWSLQIHNSQILAATELGVYSYNGSVWSLTSLAGMDVHALTISGNAIYAGTWGFGIYKSEDNGATWLPVNNGLDYFLTIQSLSTKGSTLYAGTVGGGVFTSLDGGATWTAVTVGNNIIWALGANSTAVIASAYGDGLYQSIDNGSTWNKISDLNLSFVYSIVVDLTGKIYVSSWTGGVFTSTDGGYTWTSMGMNGLGVSSVMVSPNNEDIYVGTKEGKVFKINTSITGVDGETELPTEFSLSQNYPNPFNPSTTIEFALPTNGLYSLKVYDILGQEVATLINKEMNSGVHKVTFDAGRFASGMYIYRLTGNNVNITKKMMLMK